MALRTRRSAYMLGGGSSKEEALDVLCNAIGRSLADLDRALPGWRGLSEARMRALANMALNRCITRLLGFRLFLAALEAGRWEEAAAEALDSRWASQVGRRADRLAAAIREG